VFDLYIYHILVIVRSRSATVSVWKWRGKNRCFYREIQLEQSSNP